MWGKWEKLSSTAGRAILAKPAQHADAPHAFGLLRARHERPRGCRATEQRDEVAAPQVGHRAFPPSCHPHPSVESASKRRPVRSVYLGASLPRNARQGLETDLDRSVSEAARLTLRRRYPALASRVVRAAIRS